jgi:hypothetical protein
MKSEQKLEKEERRSFVEGLEGRRLYSGSVGAAPVHAAAQVAETIEVARMHAAPAPVTYPSEAGQQGAAFVSQVFALLGRISGGATYQVPAERANAMASAMPVPEVVLAAAAAPVAAAPAEVTAMAVAASSMAPAVGAPAAVATPGREVAAVAPVAEEVKVAAPAVAARPVESLPGTSTITAVAKPAVSAVTALLNEAAAVVHTATGMFVPGAQAVATVASVVQSVGNGIEAVQAYNFLRFDPDLFVGGAAAEFARELASLTPVPGTHAMTIDHRWAWFITGAVVAADVVLVAQYQVRRARAEREKRSTPAWLFSEEFVGDYVRG